MDVKIFNLEREYRTLHDRLIDVFERVNSGGEYILGKEVNAFQEAFATYSGVRFAIGVGSGTDAIRVGGLACGLRKGDKVITTPNTYIATVMALSPHGITPVFCDIDLDTYNMDPGRLEEALNKEKGVKLCIPVHLYGHPCPMDEIMEICGRHGVAVFEDACQAHGALYKGKKVGGFGQAAAFSFYPTKNLGCYGDGGAVVTDDAATCERARQLRNYGQTAKHVHTIEGFNSRLDELQAAFLRLKLEGLDSRNERRRQLADLYRQGLREAPLVLPDEKAWAHHVYHLFVIRAPKRDKLAEYLKSKGVGTLVHYPIPIHLQQAYAHLGHKKGSFPNAESSALEILSLPMYPDLREEEVAYVCASIKDFYGR